MISTPVADSGAAHLCRYWASKLEGEHLTEPLPARERDYLATRLSVLNTAFDTIEDASDHVRKALAHWKRWVDVQPYLWVIIQRVACPVWAVAGASERIIRGEVASKGYAPTPGQFRGLAWSVAEPFWIERKVIGKIVTAKPPRAVESLEHRQAVAERIRREMAERGFRILTSPQHHIVTLDLPDF